MISGGLGGTLSRDVPLAPMTWFRVGGSAQFFYQPDSIAGLKLFLKEWNNATDITFLGAGSNVLVRDGGILGVTIGLSKAFACISSGPDNTLDVGAKAIDKRVAMVAAEYGLSGFEFLYTIPGTIGGAVIMNAGAFGGEMADIVQHVVAMDTKGNVHHIPGKEMGWSYRGCDFPKGWVALGARLKGVPADTQTILTRMNELAEKRRASQPTGKTGGSTFKNPKDQTDLKAWELLDKAGMRGASIGDAQFSTHHCNFMLNKGNATATDIETLGENARQAVLDQSGINLSWEIQRLGRF